MTDEVCMEIDNLYKLYSLTDYVTSFVFVVCAGI